MRNEVHSRQEGMYDQPPFFLNPFIYILQFLFYGLIQGSHSILKLKIEENRGDSRRNFVEFEDNLEKNRGESRFFLHFQTKSRKIEEIFQSQ